MSTFLRICSILNKRKFFVPFLNQKRNLNVHEYISYTLLKDHGISVPNFGVARTKDEAKNIAEKLNTKDLALKAQVLTGGRGVGAFKNGLKSGVHMIATPQEAEEIAGKMLGQMLVTKQTGEKGLKCNAVMVTERKYPKKEFYFAVMMERAFSGPVIMASAQGGVDIEDVAAKDPNAIHYEPVDIMKGMDKALGEKVAEKVGLSAEKAKIAEMLFNLYRLFIEKDALLIEINPYAQDDKGNYFSLDAKFRFDDNAAFRQKELFDLRDWSQEDPNEVAAAKYELNYIALDGTIGCLVNGAGLAMATCDIITLHGGSPANFLDVGGNADCAAVTAAFKIITSVPKVKSILVNIFGGIMRCDIIAEGIITAAKELHLTIPVIVRLQGTNVDKANVILKESKMSVHSEKDFCDAAKLAVEMAKK